MPPTKCFFYILGSTVLCSLLIGCGARQAVIGAAGTAGPTGPPGLVFLNAYKAGTSYVATDVVTYQGSSYVALVPSTGVAPVGAASSPIDWAILAQAGAQGTTGAQGLTGPQGITGPMGPAGSQGLVGPVGPAGPVGSAGPVGPQGPASPQVASYLNGRRFGVQGDSISSILQIPWQTVVESRTGMKEVSQDARPGRKLSEAFECYGNPAVGGQLGVFNASFVTPLGYVCGDETAGAKNGNTLAQNLANVDLQIIALGTNDEGVTIGELGDPTTAGTFFSRLRWVVETYLTAKPSMRVVLVTVQYRYNGVEQYADAEVTYGNSVGVPVINMYALGGVNAITSSTLTLDGTHPNPFAVTNFYGPVIAQALQQYF